jgi:hypothetical protein
MTDTEQDAAPEAYEKPPFMQRLLDNHFFLLFLGVVVPTVFYTIWGIIEISNIPIAK